MAEAARLRDKLPEHHRRAIAEHEARRARPSRLQGGRGGVWRRHVLLVDPPPDFVERGKAEKGTPVYRALWGKSEWNADGKLHDWDVRDRLNEIRVPTLVTSGRYDECTPELAEAAQRGIPGAERVLFEESSHMAFVEEPDRFRAVLTDFVSRAESR